MTILVVYSQEPAFPATDQNPSAVRYHVGAYWADCLGDEPTEAEITAFLTPVPPPHLNHGGLVRFMGAAPATVLEAIRMIGVTRVAKGRHRALNETLMPTDQYSVLVSIMHPTPCLWRITARTEAYVEVRVTDLAGVAIDPTEITIKTERVVYP